MIKLVDRLLKFNVKVKIAPPVSKWVDGDLNTRQIKEVKIEDLLNRVPINLENEMLGREFDNKTLLISGAAGSIGSEIVRQLVVYNFKSLILVDMSESALYDIEQELKTLYPDKSQEIKFYVSDVRDVHCMQALFAKHQPEIVFHAAAYKHVPLMENNPYEAVKINVGGTKTLVDLATKHQVERFVMVSTDKAVNPTNVMGAQKELLKCM